MRRLAIALFALSLLVGCEADTAAETTSTSAPVTTTSTSVTTTSRLTPPTTGATSTTVLAPRPEQAVYLFFEGYPVEPGPYLVPVARPGEDGLAQTLAALLEGPTEPELSMGLSSTIPEGTKLLGVAVSEGTASVDLSAEFQTGGGSLSMMGRVAQIVFTATRFDDVDSVRFLLEGQPLDVLGGEGLIIDSPQTRADWSDLIPPILVEEPLWGSTVGREIVVAGTARLESGTVSDVIVDADGLIIHEGEISSTPGERNGFTTSVTLGEIPNPGMGSIIVWEWAPDGSQRHVLEYPLNLVEMP